jgi:hypothetical protein
LTRKKKRESMTHLSGVTLDETGVDGVGKGEGGEVTLELVGLDLVGDDGDELVVDDLDL